VAAGFGVNGDGDGGVLRVRGGGAEEKGEAGTEEHDVNSGAERGEGSMLGWPVQKNARECLTQALGRSATHRLLSG